MNNQHSTFNAQRSTERWVRVSRAAPCRICGKPDWCTVAGDVACCMRVESKRPARNGGWMHWLGKLPPGPRRAPQWRPAPVAVPVIDAFEIWRRWRAETGADMRQELAARLGVSADAIEALGAAWAKPHAAWAFPMRDGSGAVIGIRLRANDGRKWAVKGSRQGIFIPMVAAQEIAFVCEGPTDTAAGLSLGVFALGRPSCNCGGEQLKLACRRLGVRRVVMVADNDPPDKRGVRAGLQGAERVAQEIGLPTVTICPPCKDLREFVNAGGTWELLECMVAQQTWRFYGR